MESKSRLVSEALRKFHTERKFVAMFEAQVEEGMFTIFQLLNTLLEPAIREINTKVQDESFDVQICGSVENRVKRLGFDEDVRVEREQIVVLETFWIPKIDFSSDNVKTEFTADERKSIATTLRKFKKKTNMTVKVQFPEQPAHDFYV